MNGPHFWLPDSQYDDLFILFDRWLKMLRQKQSHFHPQLDVEYGIIQTKIKTISEIVEHFKRRGK